MSTDRIQLRGLRVLGTIGALPEEQVRAQPFEVDLDIECDLSGAGASDDLDDTLDYGDFASTVERIVSSERHQLLERVAQRIADDVLAHDGRVTAVVVTVRKLRPPVPVDLATAAVTITRARG